VSSERSRGAGSLANTIGLALLNAMLALALPVAAVGAEPPQEQATSAAAAPPPEMRANMSYKEMAAMMGMDDAATFGKVMLDQLELEADSDHTLFSWDGQAWYGSDYNKVWLKSEGSPNASDKTDARNELLWDRIVTRWWSVQTGVRYDLGQGPARGWAAAGIEGLAPYWFDLEATLYVGEEGRTAARLRAERDLPITQRLIVQPEFETNLYGKPDITRQIGSGISDLQLGLRVRYEIRRELAPYVGLTWRRDFGATAQFARDSGVAPGALLWVAGLRTWF
jgi:copper resistance protein B